MTSGSYMTVSTIMYLRPPARVLEHFSNMNPFSTWLSCFDELSEILLLTTLESRGALKSKVRLSFKCFY